MNTSILLSTLHSGLDYILKFTINEVVRVEYSMKSQNKVFHPSVWLYFSNVLLWVFLGGGSAYVFGDFFTLKIHVLMVYFTVSNTILWSVYFKKAD